MGSSGAILSHNVQGMNRSFFSVILGSFGGTDQTSQNKKTDQSQLKVVMQMTQPF